LQLFVENADDRMPAKPPFFLSPFLLAEFPLPASPSESALARVACPNELNFANHNSPHYPLLATERHAELKGVYEGLMTNKPTRCQLHIDRRVAAERHRQLEVGGQTGDAQAALAAVKLEREKLLKELGSLAFKVYGRSGRYQMQQPNPNRRDLHGMRSIFHSLLRSAIGKVAIAPRALSSQFSSRWSISVRVIPSFDPSMIPLFGFASPGPPLKHDRLA
jgi:hypothetical protein